MSHAHDQFVQLRSPAFSLPVKKLLEVISRTATDNGQDLTVVQRKQETDSATYVWLQTPVTYSSPALSKDISNYHSQDATYEKAHPARRNFSELE